MICYSKLHDRPFLLNTSTKASGVVPVFVAIDPNPSCTKVVFNCELQEIPAIESFDIP